MDTISATSTKKLSVLLTLCVVTLLAMQFAFADSDGNRVERVETMVFDLKDRMLVLRNLAGSITIVPSNSSEARIEATVVSGGKNAKDNLDLISFEQNDLNDEIEVVALYPVDDYRTYYYNPGSRGGSYSTNVRYQQERVKVVGKQGLRKALNLHVNYTVYLPMGSEFALTNAVGDVDLNDVTADLNLNSRSGKMKAANNVGALDMDIGSGELSIRQHKGRISADTGSGGITIEDVEGDVGADTGSGSITIERAVGEISADTGSGSIQLDDIIGDTNADTGSGSIRIENVQGSLNADTGSGSIKVRGLEGTRDLRLDTGSGSVQVDGDFSSVAKMNIDTGSGSVKLRSTQMPSMVLNVDSRSGIDIDFPNMSDVRKSKASFRGTIGNGDGRGSIETGSGSVSFSMK